MKPSAHITENKYSKTPIELARMNIFSRSDENINKNDTEQGDPTISFPVLSCCDFIEIKPVEGTMIIIPSWLHHAVLPLSIKPEFRGTDLGNRISFAFNFVCSS